MYVLITLVNKTYMCPGDIISAKLCRYHKATKNQKYTLYSQSNTNILENNNNGQWSVISHRLATQLVMMFVNYFSFLSDFDV